MDLSRIFSSKKNQDLFEKYSKEEDADCVYQALGCCLLKQPFENALRVLYARPSVWTDAAFAEFAKKEQEESEFQFEVEEGIIQCRKCGSLKTIAFQKQTRSSDEGMTTFYRCIDCGTHGRYAA